MSQNEPDWKKDLTPPPLKNKGFDERLRRKIEQEIDRAESRRRKRLRLGLLPVIGGGCILALGTAVWAGTMWQQSGGDLSAPIAIEAVTAEPPHAAPAPSAASSETVVKSGLLIGLRQDHEMEAAVPDAISEAASTYRTLMIAPVDGQIRIAAEGAGILVPYGQKFWRIDSVIRRTDKGPVQLLAARPADKAQNGDLLGVGPDAQPVYGEKLLFAGNQYVSAQVKDRSSIDSSQEGYARYWVRKLNQMTGDPPDFHASAGSVRPPVSGSGLVTISDIFGEGAVDILKELKRGLDVQGQAASQPVLKAAAITADNWAVTRKPGQWSAQAVVSTAGTGKQDTAVQLLDYPATLPETVTSHDKVTAGWSQVKSAEPGAVDWLISPLEDMVVVITDKDLSIRCPVTGTTLTDERPQLRIPLQKGEQLVSAQWATGSYVAAWVDKTRKILEPQQ